MCFVCQQLNVKVQHAGMKGVVTITVFRHERGGEEDRITCAHGSVEEWYNTGQIGSNERIDKRTQAAVVSGAYLGEGVTYLGEGVGHFHVPR